MAPELAFRCAANHFEFADISALCRKFFQRAARFKSDAFHQRPGEIKFIVPQFHADTAGLFFRDVMRETGARIIRVEKYIFRGAEPFCRAFVQGGEIFPGKLPEPFQRRTCAVKRSDISVKAFYGMNAGRDMGRGEEGVFRNGKDDPCSSGGKQKFSRMYCAASKRGTVLVVRPIIHFHAAGQTELLRSMGCERTQKSACGKTLRQARRRQACDFKQRAVPAGGIYIDQLPHRGVRRICNVSPRQAIIDEFHGRYKAKCAAEKFRRMDRKPAHFRRIESSVAAPSRRSIDVLPFFCRDRAALVQRSGVHPRIRRRKRLERFVNRKRRSALCRKRHRSDIFFLRNGLQRFPDRNDYRIPPVCGVLFYDSSRACKKFVFLIPFAEYRPVFIHHNRFCACRTYIRPDKIHLLPPLYIFIFRRFSCLTASRNKESVPVLHRKPVCCDA